MIGAPTTHAGRLLVVLDGSVHTEAAMQCKELAALVNAVPVQPLKQAASSKDWHVHLESSFDAESFAPLAQRFPTFALRACDKTWKFDDQQLLELQKLLVIYSDLSAAPPEQPVPANSTTL